MDIPLEHARIYAETIPLKNGFHFWGVALESRCRFIAYLPARYSPTGRAIRKRLAETPEVRALAGRQRAARQERKKMREQEAKSTGRRGRPRIYHDGELLASIGAYRRGDRLHFRRSVPLEERARARYRFLDAEWRETISEEQYITLEIDLRRRRKRANRLRLHWDEDEAWQQAYTGITGGALDRLPQP